MYLMTEIKRYFINTTFRNNNSYASLKASYYCDTRAGNVCVCQPVTGTIGGCFIVTKGPVGCAHKWQGVPHVGHYLGAQECEQLRDSSHTPKNTPADQRPELSLSVRFERATRESFSEHFKMESDVVNASLFSVSSSFSRKVQTNHKPIDPEAKSHPPLFLMVCYDN